MSSTQTPQTHAYKPSYTTMEEATPEDVKHIVGGLQNYVDPKYLTDFYCQLLVQLKHSTEGFPIDRYEHSLQSATLACRDGKDAEYVVCALLHDVGEIFDPYAHDHVIAELLKNYISPQNYFILKTHTTFQGFYYWDKIGLNKHERDKFRDSPYFDACVEFVERYDDKAFSPTYENMPLEAFKPFMMDVFSKRKHNEALFD